jgi:hypothetical protein
MTGAARYAARFVQLIPDVLDEGVVYVSIDYRTVSHLCPCGCGEKVVTPLRPAQWTLTYDGETVTLRPSIAGGRCNSHYLITRGHVEWEDALSTEESAEALQRDQRALETALAGRARRHAVGNRASVAGRPSWWRRVLTRLRRN